MELTSTHCRAQEAIQRERASNAVLDNVKTVARNAAMAWEREALFAERMEASKARRLAIAAIAAVEQARAENEEGLPLSENPDRGRAD